MSALTTGDALAQRRTDKKRLGDRAVRKLNSAHPSANALRIRGLIEHLQALAQKGAQLEAFCRERGLMGGGEIALRNKAPLADYQIFHPDVRPLFDEIDRLSEELSALLYRYHWRPDVQIWTDGTMYQTLRWPHLDEESSWENTTVHWLLSDLPSSLQGKGAFSHFSKCARCGDWFYAGRDGAKFCSNACRVMAHSQTERGKAEKAAYMRRLREKERNKRPTIAQARKEVSVMRSPETPNTKNLKKRKARN